MNRQPDHWPTLFQTGQSIAAGGDSSTAAIYFWNAATLAPRQPLHWQSLAQALQKSAEKSESPLSQYFASLTMLPGFDGPEFVARNRELMATSPLYAQIKNEFAGDPITGDQVYLSLLVALLAQSPLPDLDLENYLVSLRSACLDAVAQKDSTDAGSIENVSIDFDPGSHAFLCALASQCFLNEYLYPVSDHEDSLLDELVNSPAGLNELQLAILAAYRPLHKIDSLSFSFSNMSPWTSRLLRTQVREPNTEYQLGKEIRRLTTISDPVSASVQLQYEENPYPRWSQINRPNPRSVKKVMISLFPRLANRDTRWPVAPEILIAGCGSGRHPALTSGRFAESTILAIDLSLPSLAYAKRKAIERNIDNIEFAQADILELGSIERRFDIIESIGVLHHMADPLQGLKILCGLLRSGGLMRLGFYSQIARRDIVAARELIANREFDATAAGLRSFRRLVTELPDEHQAKSISGSPDFFTLSGLRDFAFNIEEHRYTLEQLEYYLSELDLEFLGFELTDPDTLRQYRQQFPQDSDATSLANWHAFEQDNPDTFASMYQFWVVGK